MEASLKKIIEENGIKEKLFRQDLVDAIPVLLERALELEIEKGYSPQLSSFFKEKNSNNEFCYMGLDGKIYLLKGNSYSDLTDPFGSDMIIVSKEEFLEWAKENTINALDVYNHLVEYITSNKRYEIAMPVDSYL